MKEKMNTTYSAKPSEVERKWYLVDAEDVVLGRLSAEVSKILRGKHKPTFTPHIDCGDFVVIINAEKVKLTGKKLTDKIYYKHTGFPGGLKSTTPEKVFESKNPERVVIKSIERMVSRGKLGRAQMTKLKVYAGTEHPHASQKPEVLDIASRNPKNKRSS